MPPVTEKDQLQQLTEDVKQMKKVLNEMGIQLSQIVIAVRGNTDLDPNDKGLFGTVRWLKTEVLNWKRDRAKITGMIAGGVAVGAAAGTIITFIFTYFFKK